MSDKCDSCRELADAYHRERSRAERLEEVVGGWGHGGSQWLGRVGAWHGLIPDDVEGMLLEDRLRLLVAERASLRAEVVKLRATLASGLAQNSAKGVVA